MACCSKKQKLAVIIEKEETFIDVFFNFEMSSFLMKTMMLDHLEHLPAKNKEFFLFY